MKIVTHSILFFFCFNPCFLQAQTSTFDYTGAVQTYTVPPCVYSVTVDVKGASGTAVGTSYSAPGKGGRVQATLPVTPGETFNIYVGQRPTNNTGGWNGGGTGGSSGGGGGGASDIRQGGAALTNRIIIAGGGGGGGFDYGHVYVNTGGQGGDINGGHGVANSSQTYTWGGAGGTQTEGGAPGTGTGGNGSAGDLGIGGDADAVHGGGGGAGYYGGGGGTTSPIFGGGGGGGSSYTTPAATNVIHSQGFNSGDGKVEITAAVPGPPAPDSIIGPDSACIGSTTTYYIDSVSGATSYTWTFPAGTTIRSGEGTASVEVAIGTTSGDISVTATNTCGTSEARTKPLTVVDCGGTGIRSNSDKLDLLVFPNPAADVLHLQLNAVVLKQVNVAMMNVQGQVVYSGTIHAGLIKEVDISSLPKGFYYLRAMSEGFFVVRKIVIQ